MNKGPLCINSACDVCSKGYYLWIDGPTRLCYAYNDIPIGRGIDTSTNRELKSCSDTGCKICKDDYTKCSECTDPKQYINSNFICTVMPASTGFKSRNPDVIEACTAGTNCEDCIDDYTNCVTCKSPNYFLKVGSNACITETQIEDGYGHQSGSPENILPCHDSLCKDCKAVHTVCIECKTNKYIDPSNVCADCEVDNGWYIDDKHCKACNSLCK